MSRHRSQYDPAANVGVPAHITVAYPFKPIELLTDDDQTVLTQVLARFHPFEVTFRTTGWFGDEMLFLDPSDGAPVLALIAAVEHAFPDYPIYGGTHEDVHPHVTVGKTPKREALEAVERDVLAFLPIKQLVDAVELWQGPALAAGLGSWGHLQTFILK